VITGHHELAALATYQVADRLEDAARARTAAGLRRRARLRRLARTTVHSLAYASPFALPFVPENDENQEGRS
jgi:hypothetical protein